MSIYICEKCGCLENTALGTYWENLYNKEPVMCSECSTGNWHNKFKKEHWSKHGVDKLLQLEKRKDGSMINATAYFKSIGKI